MEQQLKFYHPAFVKSLVCKSMIINTIENKNTLTLEPEEFSAISFLGLQRSYLQLSMTGNTILKNSNIYITFCLCFVFCLLSHNLSRVLPLYTYLNRKLMKNLLALVGGVCSCGMEENIPGHTTCCTYTFTRILLPDLWLDIYAFVRCFYPKWIAL